MNAELREKFHRDFELMEVSKGDKLLQQDIFAYKLNFIEQGVIHNYYYYDGKKVTSWFYAKKQFLTTLYSFYIQKLGFEEIECLEDCILYAISFEKYQKLIADLPAFGNFVRLLAEENLSILDCFSKGWSFLSAKEKYDLLQTYFPQIEQRVKLGLIALFLEISQEILSRIRGKK